MSISRTEFVATWFMARFYLALATMAALVATGVIWVGDKLNNRGQRLATFLKESSEHEKK